MSDIPDPFSGGKPQQRADPFVGGAVARAMRAGPPAQPETSTMGALWEGVQHGLGNIAMGAGRLGGRMLWPDEQNADLDKVAQFREREFLSKPMTRQHPTATAIGEFGGEAAATSPLAAATGGGSSATMRAIWGALTGAGGGALGAAASAPSQGFGRSVAGGAGMGGALGGALGGGGALLRPPVLERPLGGGQAAPQPVAPQPQQPPMLALPPPTVQVAGQPAVQTGTTPGQFDQMALGLMNRQAGDPVMRSILERTPPPGIIPPGPTSTMTAPSATPGPTRPASRLTMDVGEPPRAPIPPAAPVPRPAMPPPPKSWADAARMLDRADVRLSPGQARNMSEMERTLQTWPILRGFVRGQVGRSVDDFDRAVVLQSLAPIGGVVPRGVKAGHDLMDFAAKRFDEAYNPLLPHLRLNRDGIIRAIDGNQEMLDFVGSMSEDHARRLTNMATSFLKRFDDGGVMNGETFKRAESELSRRSSSWSGTNDDELAVGVRRMLGMFRDELADQNPQYGPELQKINHAYSLFAEARAAAVRDADSKGRFTPHDLLETVKHASSEGQFSRGIAPLQAFAEAGNEVIGPSLTSRRPELSRSAMRVIGDTAAGAVLTPGYLAAAGAQRVPGLGRGVEALAPSVGADVGHRMQRRGPYGGKIISQSSFPAGR